MSATRRVAVVTTSRADYGLLYWTLRALKDAADFELLLLTCGSHLDPARGATETAILEDGFTVDARIDTTPAADDDLAVANAVAAGTSAFAQTLHRMRPDLLLCLGDRYELLAGCTAAALLRIPIAHMHGGESSEGVIDELTRHAITKLSHLHFPAAEPYRRRILRMGEDPKAVVTAGAAGIEFARRCDFLHNEKLVKTVSIPLNRRYAMLTYHPSPVDGTAAEKAVETIFKAVDAENLDAVASYANADAGGSAINAALDRAAQSRPGRVHLSPSLGQIQYLSLMRGASVVIGNSSSGIIEAPALGVPVVNIGFRQRGRLRAPAVLDCSLEPDALRDALDHALSDDFRMRRCTGETPYGDGNTSSIVVATMRSTTLDRRFLMKRFHDGDETKG